MTPVKLHGRMGFFLNDVSLGCKQEYNVIQKYKHNLNSRRHYICPLGARGSVHFLRARQFASKIAAIVLLKSFASTFRPLSIHLFARIQLATQTCAPLKKKEREMGAGGAQTKRKHQAPPYRVSGSVKLCCVLERVWLAHLVNFDTSV